MQNKFNYKNYWRKRLEDAGESLKGVGHKRYSEHANKLLYKKAEGELTRAIKELGIKIKNKTVLDAGAGIGLYSKFYLDRGAKVTAIDISSHALKLLKGKYSDVEIKCVGLDETLFLGKRKFDIVHCFDVLYHIVDENHLKKAIDNICNYSNEFIIIHDAPRYWGNIFDFLFERKHIKIKTSAKLIRKIKGNGFAEIGYYPTGIFYSRPPVSMLVGFFPYPFYLIDKFLIKFLPFRGLEISCIRIFKKNN